MVGGTNARNASSKQRQAVQVGIVALVLLVGMTPAAHVAGAATRGSCVTVFTDGPGIEVDPNCDPVGGGHVRVPALHLPGFFGFAIETHLPGETNDGNLTLNRTVVNQTVANQTALPDANPRGSFLFPAYDMDRQTSAGREEAS